MDRDFVQYLAMSNNENLLKVEQNKVVRVGVQNFA